MRDVPAGLYEHLLTHGLDSKLAAAPPGTTQFGTLDPADSHDALTRHIARL
ncbi:MAG: type restriction protein res subunit, partial [Blastococcus sp.]|nr:type restriction protein res subunit [Blastococcus sp.]